MDQGDGWQPAPLPGGDERPVLCTLEVDGQLFAVREADGGGTHYDWLSGPNDGYGFTSSGSPTRATEDHRDDIRSFLSQIDPRTGYIEDD